MPAATQTKPVEDTVPKINNELALGSDPDFQRKWWKFEKTAWIILTIIILMDVAGVFGRGPLANAERQTSDGSLHVKYERIERYGTPSQMTLHFGSGSIHDGKVQLWASDSLLSKLGNQRISPEPMSSTLVDDGILYTFAAAGKGDSVELSLQPAGPGKFPLALRVPGSQTLNLSVFVMP